MSFEIACFVAILLVGFAATWRFTEGALRAFTAIAITLTFALGAARFQSQRLSNRRAPVAIRPADSGAVGSGACRACHPSEHASWWRSFHRTMTQLATPSSIAGPWDGTRVEADGRSIELSRRGDELWIRLPDPDLVAAGVRGGVREPSRSVPLVSRRVLLTTGSHHHQAYWVKGERGNELRLAPITYLIADRRYVSRHDAFLQPPDAPAHATRWNSNCIQCHAMRGEPRLDEPTDVFASSATELGIACEACHGPGGEHVEKHQNPVTRFVAHAGDAADPSIVNPKRLSRERASEVCGQCHAYFVPRDESRFWTSGYDYRPGDALERSRTLLEPSASGAGLVEAATESLFWGDGTIRVGGREWNGLRASACFSHAKKDDRRISCLSCHSLHDSEPDDQLRRGSLDAPCVECHRAQADAGSLHTHHSEGSSGVACVSCHMPFTSYALFTAIRSHRIDSPSAVVTADTGRPNACNLCHLDRTLAWTAETLDSWYRAGRERERARTDAGQRALASTTARAVEELLAGDAATRAVVAAAFGRTDARGVGSGWKAGLLAELVLDPYAAVRHVALESLAALPGFSDVNGDFVAPAEARAALRRTLLARAASLARPPRSNALPLDTEGRRDEARIRALLASRDEHPTTISE